jgi:phosphotriesterase-related protein
MHEHTFVLSPEMNANYPETLGNEDAMVADAIHQYLELKATGIDTIVDVSVIGHGRYIPRIQKIAAAVDLNIVVCTGLYFLVDVPTYFAFRGPGTSLGGPEFIPDIFIRDIKEGIGNTGVRAGMIKVAIHLEGLTPIVSRVLRASAVAHRATGAPITTHTSGEPGGLLQQQLFREEGVDLSRVVIGHTLGSAVDNPDYVRELMANGSTVGFDSWRPLASIEAVLQSQGLPSDSEDYRNILSNAAERQEKEYQAVAALVGEGHANQIVLSHDHCCYIDSVDPRMFEVYDKSYVWTTVVPALRDRGVSDEDIDMMLIANPRRIFETAADGGY